MASITWDDVGNLATELSGTAVSLVAQEAILLLVNSYFDVNNWGGESGQKLRMARIYLAAHLATLGSLRKGKPGAVQSESMGGISRSYANPMMTSAVMLSTTTYGQMLTMLGRSTAARAGFTTGNPSKGFDPGWGG